MRKFPGIENIATKLCFRALGGADSFERFGVGFMDKSDRSTDNEKFTYPYYVLVYVLSGKGTYVDEEVGRSYELSSGSFFQRIPGRLHSHYIDTSVPWKEVFIDVGPGIFDMYRKLRLLRCDQLCGRIGLDMTQVEKLWRLHELLELADQSKLASVFNEVIGVLFELHSRMDFAGHDDAFMEMVEAAQEYLSQDFSDRLNLIDFCRRNGWGYESFRKKFTAYTGFSPGQYRIRRRIETAAAMLSERRLSIAEIAWKLGYKSPYEFSSQFKKYTGTSPSRFIKG